MKLFWKKTPVRNHYQQVKWDLFQRIQKTKDKEERSELLSVFNNMTGKEQQNKLYEEAGNEADTPIS